jgi:phasin family protein
MTVAYTDFAAFNQNAFDTMVKSNTAAAEGVEKLTKHLVDYSSKSVEDAVTASKKLYAVKTPVEFVQLQMKLAQDSFEALISESKKVSDLTTAIVKDVTAPVSDNFSFAAPVPTKSSKKAA